jgi:ribonuclease BN (tRNA processing enzyme)
MLGIQQNYNYFPVSLESRPCAKKYNVIAEGNEIRIGNFKITSKALNHPGGSFAYRVESGAGGKIVYSTDGEYTAGAVLESFYPFYRGADILILDTQYSFNELAGRFNFGHSTAEIGVDAAVNCGVAKLLLFHHNHDSDDDKINRMFVSANKYLTEKYPSAELEIIISNEGMEFDL